MYGPAFFFNNVISRASNAIAIILIQCTILPPNFFYISYLFESTISTTEILFYLEILNTLSIWLWKARIKCLKTSVKDSFYRLKIFLFNLEISILLFFETFRYLINWVLSLTLLISLLVNTQPILHLFYNLRLLSFQSRLATIACNVAYLHLEFWKNG